MKTLEDQARLRLSGAMDDVEAVYPASKRSTARIDSIQALSQRHAGFFTGYTNYTKAPPSRAMTNRWIDNQSGSPIPGLLAEGNYGLLSATASSNEALA